MPEPMAKAVATVRIDNDRVRVTEWRFAPGAHTGHHRHEYAYVVVPMTSGPLAIRSAAGDATAQLTSARPTIATPASSTTSSTPTPASSSSSRSS